MLHSVALYGFASASREGVWNSKADEVWSVVWAYKYDIPRLDRLLEIHPIWLQAASDKEEYIKPREHWEWLKQNTTIPVYMLTKRPEIPMCVRYPIEDAMKLVHEGRRKKVFTSSFDYLMALAILEGVKRIEVYGFEMGSDTEYRYQREGAAYWIAQCDARGIEVVLPSNTALLKNKLYGYEGGSMIYRQDLERIKAARETQKRDAFARLNALEGQIQLLKDNLPPDMMKQYEDQYRFCNVVSGRLQELEYLMREIDLEEPDDIVIDPVETISVER
jgi:hypothetical protein